MAHVLLIHVVDITTGHSRRLDFGPYANAYTYASVMRGQDRLIQFQNGVPSVSNLLPFHYLVPPVQTVPINTGQVAACRIAAGDQYCYVVMHHSDGNYKIFRLPADFPAFISQYTLPDELRVN